VRVHRRLHRPGAPPPAPAPAPPAPRASRPDPARLPNPPPTADPHRPAVSPPAPPPARPRRSSAQPVEKIEDDCDRDFFMTPEEAKDYGIIDEVLASKIRVPTPARPVRRQAPTLPTPRHPTFRPYHTHPGRLSPAPGAFCKLSIRCKLGRGHLPRTPHRRRQSPRASMNNDSRIEFVSCLYQTSCWGRQRCIYRVFRLSVSRSRFSRPPHAARRDAPTGAREICKLPGFAIAYWQRVTRGKVYRSFCERFSIYKLTQRPTVLRGPGRLRRFHTHALVERETRTGPLQTQRQSSARRATGWI
jgi:hypothetical protein